MSTSRVPDGDRRLRALRALLDYRSPAVAAEQLGHPITANRWTEIERPGRPARLERWEAEKIAAAAGIHLDLLTEPVDHLGSLGAPPRRALGWRDHESHLPARRRRPAPRFPDPGLGGQTA